MRKLFRAIYYRFGVRLFSFYTLHNLHMDLWRLRARLIHRHNRSDLQPKYDKLHIGCGTRKVPGWLNVDVVDSDYDLDLACGRLPFASESFEAMLSQHVIEHLDLRRELIPLFRELRRIAKPDCEIYLSTPDMEVVCKSFFEHRGEDLLKDRISRWSKYSLEGLPAIQMINDLFVRDGEHKNLFDLDLLTWVLESTGFGKVKRIKEKDLLKRFPEFPPRNDDYSTLYVRAVAVANPKEKK